MSSGPQAQQPAYGARAVTPVDDEGQFAYAQRQGATKKNAVQTSAANTAQTVTLAAVGGKRITVRQVIVFASAAGSATLTVSDGTTALNFGTVALTAEAKVFAVLVTGDVGVAVSVNVGAAGVGVTTTVSVVADAP